MPDHRAVAEIVRREINNFVANTRIDPCWRKLVSDLQALPLLGAPHCVSIRPNGEFISFVYETWEGGVPDVRLEDDDALRTEALFYGITKYPSLKILCSSKPFNGVTCWQCGGTGMPSVAATDSCTCRGLGWLPPNRHLDPKTLVIKCEGPESIREAVKMVNRQLAPEVRGKLNKIRMPFVFQGSEGDKALFERMNNRSVADILADTGFEEDRVLIASGQVGDLRYELFDAPDPNKVRPDNTSGSSPQPVAKDPTRRTEEVSKPTDPPQMTDEPAE